MPRRKTLSAILVLFSLIAGGHVQAETLTNAFSKKVENHFLMLSLYFVHYNFLPVAQEPANVARDDRLRL